MTEQNGMFVDFVSPTRDPSMRVSPPDRGCSERRTAALGQLHSTAEARVSTASVAACLGFVAALCVPTAAGAVSWLQPGGTVGTPLGVPAPNGVYGSLSYNYGEGGSDPGLKEGIIIPGITVVPGWELFGGKLSFSAFGIFPDNNFTDGYGVYNPYINPITLSYDLGGGYFASAGIWVFLPWESNRVIATGEPGGSNKSGTTYELSFAASYVKDGWIMSANNFLGFPTEDENGVRAPNYYNIDLTVARELGETAWGGKWGLGVIGFGAWDLETTPFNEIPGPGSAQGIGAIFGTNFGKMNVSLAAAYQFNTDGWTNFEEDDTRVYLSISFPFGGGAKEEDQKFLHSVRTR